MFENKFASTAAAIAAAFKKCARVFVDEFGMNKVSVNPFGI